MDPPAAGLRHPVQPEAAPACAGVPCYLMHTHTNRSHSWSQIPQPPKLLTWAPGPSSSQPTELWSLQYPALAYGHFDTQLPTSYATHWLTQLDLHLYLHTHLSNWHTCTVVSPDTGASRHWFHPRGCHWDPSTHPCTQDRAPGQENT